uniref:Transforming acidic coiled-coil-containing protein C-terminal domain-containing protein n=1 Tax=Athene cunicularia TaxID=194338 RepID=A0A663MID0_ATHCN
MDKCPTAVTSMSRSENPLDSICLSESEKTAVLTLIREEIITKEIEANEWKKKYEESRQEVLEMRKIVAEYEKTIAQMIEDEQRTNMTSQKNLQQLTMEKDQALADLNSVERSLSDLFRRYENLKGVLEGFKKVLALVSSVPLVPGRRVPMQHCPPPALPSRCAASDPPAPAQRTTRCLPLPTLPCMSRVSRAPRGAAVGFSGSSPRSSLVCSCPATGRGASSPGQCQGKRRCQGKAPQKSLPPSRHRFSMLPSWIRGSSIREKLCLFKAFFCYTQKRIHHPIRATSLSPVSMQMDVFLFFFSE